MLRLKVLGDPSTPRLNTAPQRGLEPQEVRPNRKPRLNGPHGVTGALRTRLRCIVFACQVDNAVLSTGRDNVQGLHALSMGKLEPKRADTAMERTAMRRDGLIRHETR